MLPQSAASLRDGLLTIVLIGGTSRLVSCGPKGPFVSGGAAWPDRAQLRCGAHGEAKPQAVRRRAFIEVAARRPAARRFSWLRVSAPDAGDWPREDLKTRDWPRLVFNNKRKTIVTAFPCQQRLVEFPSNVNFRFFRFHDAYIITNQQLSQLQFTLL